MAERQNQPFQLSSNISLSVDFRGLRVTSDGGLILIREMDERLGFGELFEQRLTDSRAQNARLPFADLLHARRVGRLACVGSWKYLSGQSGDQKRKSWLKTCQLSTAAATGCLNMARVCARPSPKVD